MNTVFSKLKEDEINIDFLYVLKECIKYVRYVIVVAVVFAILLPMIKYKVDYDAYILDIQNIEQNSIENLEKNLTILEKNTLSEYENLLAKIKHFEDYQSESIIMSMDVENVYGMEMQFWIDASEEKRGPLTSFYVNFTRNMGLSEMIASKGSNEAGTLHELIWINSAEDGIIELYIVNQSKEALNELVAQIEKAYSDYSNTIREITCDHSIKCIQKEYYFGYEDAIFSKQKSFYEGYASLMNQKSQMEQSFTENLRLIMLKNENGNEITELKSPSVEIFYGILGFILGLVLGLVSVVVKAVLDGRIHSATEVNRRLGYRHLEHICLASKRMMICLGNGIKKENDEVLELILTKIISQISNDETKRIALVSNGTNAENVCVEKIVEALDKYGVKVDILYDVVHNTKEYKVLEEHKYVVYVSEIGAQKIKKLYQENDIFTDIGVEILGYVSVSE